MTDHITDPFCPLNHSEGNCLTCVSLRKLRYAMQEDALVAYQKGRQDASEAVMNLWLGREMDNQILTAFLAAQDAALGRGGRDN